MNSNNVNIAALDLNLITALHALLECQSVSEAADSVGRTQSAMSHSLARLRDHFQDPILVRDGWAMQRTPFAEDLRTRAAQAARAAEAMFETTSGFDPATTRRRIRIAAPDLCGSLFARFLADLPEQAPKASVVFVEGVMARQAVLTAQVDIGLGFGHPKSDPNLVVHPLPPLSWCTFAPLDHPYRDTTSPETWLAARHVVVGQGGTQEGPVETALRRQGMKRQVVCSASNFSAALGLAAETGALFTTLRQPFERIAHRLSMAPCPLPFDMPDAPAALMFRKDYGDPFSIWLRKRCVAALDP